jgi:hypothetical protein
VQQAANFLDFLDSFFHDYNEVISGDRTNLPELRIFYRVDRLAEYGARRPAVPSSSAQTHLLALKKDLLFHLHLHKPGPCALYLLAL